MSEQKCALVIVDEMIASGELPEQLYPTITISPDTPSPRGAMLAISCERCLGRGALMQIDGKFMGMNEDAGQPQLKNKCAQL